SHAISNGENHGKRLDDQGTSRSRGFGRRARRSGRPCDGRSDRAGQVRYGRRPETPHDPGQLGRSCRRARPPEPDQGRSQGALDREALASPYREFTEAPLSQAGPFAISRGVAPFRAWRDDLDPTVPEPAVVL